MLEHFTAVLSFLFLMFVIWGEVVALVVVVLVVAVVLVAVVVVLAAVALFVVALGDLPACRARFACKFVA